MDNLKQKEFNKFQSIFWPIHAFELKKLLPMSFLMMFMLLVYTMVRDLKEVFLQTYATLWDGAKSEASTDLIGATKLWFLLPSTFLAVMAFNAIVGKYGSKKTFYIMMSFFMIFYAIFGFILFPNIKSLTMSEQTITNIRNSLPSWLSILKPVVACIGNWPYICFYVISEIWGIMAVASLFWQFANKITMKHEVKRFFAMFSILGNVGVFLSGTTLNTMAKRAPTREIFNQNVIIIMIGVVICCIIIMSTYYWINKYVLTDPRLYVPDHVKPKKAKEKVKFTEGIKLMLKSRNLRLLFILILGLGLAISLTDLSFEAQFKKLYSDPSKYSEVKGNLSRLVAVSTTVFVFIGTNLLRRCRWRTCACIPPMIFLVVGAPFYILAIYSTLTGKSSLMGLEILPTTVFLGFIADALSKSVKYSIADTTRNMVFRLLPEEESTKGQAAVEVIGGRFGKAGGSAFHQILITIVQSGSTIADHFAIVFGVFIATIGGWVTAIFKLSPSYEKMAKENESKLNNVEED